MSRGINGEASLGINKNHRLWMTMAMFKLFYH